MKLTPEQIVELENETISLCQELIRIPSVNHGEGKGDEKAVAEFIASKLKEVGIESELIETAPNRVNVVARIAGSDSKRCLHNAHRGSDRFVCSQSHPIWVVSSRSREK